MDEKGKGRESGSRGDFDVSEGWEDEISSLLDSMPGMLSDDWDSECERLWSSLIDSVEESERARLISNGKSESQIGRLVKRGWAVARGARIKILSTIPADPRKAVPVVLVLKDGSLTVPDSLEFWMSSHPLLARANEKRVELRPEARVQEVLASLRDLSAKFGFDECGRMDHLDFMDTELNNASCAVVAGFDLECALDEEGFVEEATLWDFEEEECQWLVEAKSAQRFWYIVSKAIDVGHLLALHHLFEDGSVTQAVARRIANPGGKSVSPEGKEVEEIILAFRAERNETPTPARLLKWLDAKDTEGDASQPLIVDRPLWGSALEKEEVSREEFTNLVKSRRRNLGL